MRSRTSYQPDLGKPWGRSQAVLEELRQYHRDHKQRGLGKDVYADRGTVQAIMGDQTISIPAPGGGEPYVIWPREGQTIDGPRGLAAEVLGLQHIRNPDDKQIAGMAAEIRARGKELGLDEAQLTERLNEQQAIALQAYRNRMAGMEQLLTRAQQEPVVREKIAGLLGMEPSQANGDQALKALADGLMSSDTKVREAAAAQVESIRSALETVIKPEQNSWFDQPVAALKDLPVAQSFTNGGMALAASAGASAAAVALANHLMAKGQQQTDPVAYATALQAMNAY